LEDRLTRAKEGQQLGDYKVGLQNSEETHLHRAEGTCGGKDHLARREQASWQGWRLKQVHIYLAMSCVGPHTVALLAFI
jgi:hypothetical protein